MSLCFYDQNLGILKKVRILMKVTKKKKCHQIKLNCIIYCYVTQTQAHIGA